MHMTRPAQASQRGTKRRMRAGTAIPVLPAGFEQNRVFLADLDGARHLMEQARELACGDAADVLRRVDRPGRDEIHVAGLEGHGRLALFEVVARGDVPIDNRGADECKAGIR